MTERFLIFSSRRLNTNAKIIYLLESSRSGIQLLQEYNRDPRVDLTLNKTCLQILDPVKIMDFLIIFVNNFANWIFDFVNS